MVCNFQRQTDVPIQNERQYRAIFHSLRHLLECGISLIVSRIKFTRFVAELHGSNRFSIGPVLRCQLVRSCDA